MQFRRAKEQDAAVIMKIIEQAQADLKESGIDQWQNGYPNMEVILNDIMHNNSYVLIEGDQLIGAAVGTAVISFDGEETYSKIYNGNWISAGQYAVIHRIAIAREYKGKGLSSGIIENAEAMCREREVRSIRVDTHKDNISMQKMLSKNGFKYCGIIYLKDGSERLAYEKLL